jgi:hypothetical protein
MNAEKDLPDFVVNRSTLKKRRYSLSFVPTIIEPILIKSQEEAANLSKVGGFTRDRLKTIKTDGILASVLYNADKHEKIDLLSLGKPYLWKTCDEPLYRERLKKSSIQFKSILVK